MLANKINFAASVATFCMFLGGSAQAANANHNWQLITTNDRAFSVMMPGVPKAKTEQGKSQNGVTWTSTIYDYVTPDNSEGFNITVVDFSANLDAAGFLEEQRKTEAGRGKILWQHDETLNGHPGKKIAATNGKIIWVAEVYVAGNRIYYVRYTTTNLLHGVMSAAPFLESFKIA
jgi:hypothetical protein